MNFQNVSDFITSIMQLTYKLLSAIQHRDHGRQNNPSRRVLLPQSVKLVDKFPDCVHLIRHDHVLAVPHRSSHRPVEGT
jgi:hypothetical protein